MPGRSLVPLDAVPRRKLGIRVRRHRGELLVAVDGEAFALDGTAEFIFARIDGVTSVAALGRGLAEEFEVDEAQAGADAGEFLRWLLDNDLIELDLDGDP